MRALITAGLIAIWVAAIVLIAPREWYPRPSDGFLPPVPFKATKQQTSFGYDPGDRLCWLKQHVGHGSAHLLAALGTHEESAQRPKPARQGGWPAPQALGGVYKPAQLG